MHVKNITKNYRLLNILIGEYYVTKSAYFFENKRRFEILSKKMSHFEE